MKVRPATPADSRMIWEWANDPTTRAVSFSTDPIPWPDHAAWFERVLTDPDHLLLVGEVDGIPVGTVRFDRDGEEAEVSITVALEQRGRGLSRPMLQAALNHAPASRVVAYVRLISEGEGLISDLSELISDRRQYRFVHEVVMACRPRP
jgi:L-amino acid N-acyltransferase YncA